VLVGPFTYRGPKPSVRVLSEEIYRCLPNLSGAVFAARKNCHMEYAPFQLEPKSQEVA
jgi:hypothetical protein